MEILLTGYTAFLTQEWIETAFPDDHVLTTHTKSEALLDTRVKTVTLDGKQLLAAMERRDTLAAALEELAEEQEHEHHHHYDENGVCSCGHHHHHHHGHDADEVFVSWGTETVRKFGEDELSAMLSQLDGGEYGLVLRAKGIVPCTDGGWIHFDYTPGEQNIRKGPADYTGRLCVIGSKLVDEKLAKLFGVA